MTASTVGATQPASTSHGEPGATTTMPIGYLVPEFPGQTHVWIWRELDHLRSQGWTLRLFSTRTPPARDRARHAFADAAVRETTFLIAPGLLTRSAQLSFALAWAAVTRPLALLSSLRLALSLPLDDGRRAALPLLAPAARLARQARRARLEHLHVHSCANAAVVAMLTERLVGLPYSLTLNADIGWWGGAMAEKFAGARFVVATSRWLLEQVQRDHPGLPAGKASLCHVGVDTERWQPAASAASAADDGSARVLRVVSVGRLHVGKGHDVLLQAVARLRDDGLSLRVQIVGGGPERDALTASIRQLQLEDVVTLTGSAGEEQVMTELRTADVFVLASRAEALGVVYMEAMAMGVPAIGTRVGGVPEVIEDGVDGITVPPDDAPALADAIARLAADPALRQRLGQAGRHKVVAHFDSRAGAARLAARIAASHRERATTAQT